ncbi:MAG: hypothetical protein ACXW04_08700 [Methylobacter sp.]
MKKKAFLTSVAVLATSMAVNAGAALPNSLTEQVISNAEYTVQGHESASKAQNPFVLERPDASDNVNVADHYSHRSHSSHSSHRSHVSSRY